MKLKIHPILKFVLLLSITFLTTTLSGVEWADGRSVWNTENLSDWDFWITGFKFSIPFLLILTFHEFGHYLTAKYYKADVTLPTYIPMWFLGIAPSIGTLGAFIRIKSPLKTRTEFFDVGVAGPLAGFIVAIGFIWYGFATLPNPEAYIFNVHEDYAAVADTTDNWEDVVYTREYRVERDSILFKKKYPDSTFIAQDEYEGLHIGSNLLFMFFERYVADPELVPNRYEMMHYPFLFAGFLACFFTALNLIPIGQLDGGHVIYGLIGYEKFNKISPYIFTAFIFYAGLGLVTPAIPFEDLMLYGGLYLLYLNLAFSKMLPDIKNRLMVCVSIFAVQYFIGFPFPELVGYTGWLLFGLIIGRMLGVFHPPAIVEEEISFGKKVIGWIAILVFILCFSPNPLEMIVN